MPRGQKGSSKGGGSSRFAELFGPRKTPEPKRKARKLSDDNAEKLEKAFQAALIKLNSKTPMKSDSVKLSLFKIKVRFHSIDAEGITFKNSK